MNLQQQRLQDNVASRCSRVLVVVSMVAWVTMASAVAWGQAATENEAARAKNAKPNAAEGQKWALLIGVDHYLDPRLGNLRFCGADVRALRDVLVRQGGFPADQVIVLHDQEKEPVRQPLRLSIERSLKALLAQAGPQDLILVSFSGHGVQVGETAYLCPTEADLDKPEATMVSVASLYEKLSKECRAAQKIVFVDACRKPVESGQKAPALELAKGFSERLRQVPEGLLILSSCKSGQLSYEEKDFGHGVFAHFLLDGLTGKADARGPNLRGNGDGRIDVDELFNYASTQTGKYVMNKFVEAQTPELYGIRRGPIDLLAALPDVKEVLDKTLRAARLISDEFTKAWCLNLIAAAQAKSGYFVAAMDTARSISRNDPYNTNKIEALCAIASVQASVGDKQAARATLTEALDVARTLGNTSAFSHIALAQLDFGENHVARATLREALQAARSMTNDSVRTTVLQSIAAAQAKTGEFTVALDTARSISGDEFYKVSALLEIASAQASVGDKQAAKTILMEALQASRSIANEFARTSSFIAIAAEQAGVGDKQAARTTLTEVLQMSGRISDNELKTRLMESIAAAQAEMRDFGDAMETVRLIGGNSENVSVQRSIALAHAKVGDFSASLRTARSIGDQNSKVSVLRDIAKAQAKTGDKPATSSTLQEAVEVSDSIKNASTKAIALRDTAVLQGEVLDKVVARATFQKALQSASAIEDDNQRLGVLNQILVTQTKSGGLADADVPMAELESTIQRMIIGTGSERRFATVAIAQLFVQSLDNAVESFKKGAAAEIRECEEKGSCSPAQFSLFEFGRLAIPAGYSQQVLDAAETLRPSAVRVQVCLEIAEGLSQLNRTRDTGSAATRLVP